MQNKKLADFIKHQIPFHKFYRDLFKKKKIKFDEIKTTDDLQKLPFTTKKDIAPTSDDPGKTRKFIIAPTQELIKKHAKRSKLVSVALGRLFNKERVKANLEDEYKPVHVHFTTGRTALPTPFTYTDYDLKRLVESGLRCFRVFKISKDDIAVNAFPYAPHLAFWLTYFAAYNTKTMTLHTGGGRILGTKKILAAFENLKATAGVFMSGYCYHVIREAVENKKDFSSLKKLIFGGERVPEGLIKKLKDMLSKIGASNVEILSTYALTEGKVAWAQCCEGSDYHLYPDMEFIEVVDEEGNRVKEGEKGEIVYTALDFRGTVVLRYKTGDTTDGIYYDQCPHCGRTVPRLNPNIQRKSDIKEFQFRKIKGELINLNLLLSLLAGHQMIDEWQIEIRKINDDPYELDELIIHAAPRGKIEPENVIESLEKDVKDEIGITPKVDITSLEDVVKRLKFDTEVKERRIVDNRPKV
jgi:phenylacetate-coenzyme A ligase PaaK-like adenylate-forming protein